MRSVGFKIEQSVKDYLIQQGLEFIAANYNTRLGEIDLIMLDKTTLCFIEVRHRKNASYGSAAESITPSKQEKIRKTALAFLQKNKRYSKVNCRFDVVLSQGNDKQFDWIQNAF